MMPSNEQQWKEYDEDWMKIRQCIPMDYDGLDDAWDMMGTKEREAWEDAMGAEIDSDTLYAIAYHAASRGYQLGLSRSWGKQ